jgi:hypothetical protein
MRFLPALMLASAVAAMSGAASARDCRPAADAPPGVRVPDRPGCKPAQTPKAAEPGLKAGREPGFVDLGNGTEVRIGGRVRVETRSGR